MLIHVDTFSSVINQDNGRNRLVDIFNWSFVDSFYVVLLAQTKINYFRGINPKLHEAVFFSQFPIILVSVLLLQ